MVKYLRISSYIRKPFLINDLATDPIWISLYVRKILFSFLSVYMHCQNLRPLLQPPRKPGSRRQPTSILQGRPTISWQPLRPLHQPLQRIAVAGIQPIGVRQTCQRCLLCSVCTSLHRGHTASSNNQSLRADQPFPVNTCCLYTNLQGGQSVAIQPQIPRGRPTLS